MASCSGRACPRHSAIDSLAQFAWDSGTALTRDTGEDRGSGRFLWTGRGGDCNVVLSSTAAGLSGVVSCSNANYGLAGNPGALHLDRYDPNPLGPPAGIEDAVPPISSEELSALEAGAPTVPLTPPEDAIDILVLYQEPVRAALDPAGGVTHTVAFAQQCVDVLQQALVASQVPVRVHMVAAKKVSRISYGDVFQDYVYLRDNAEPKALRNFWAADIVVYLTYYGDQYYGTSVIPGSTAPPNSSFPPPGPSYAPLAEVVVQYNTAIQDTTGGHPQQPYVFMHEFAHVIGANHNHEDSSNTTPLEVGGFGHWAVSAKNGSLRTILSNPTSQCSTGGACTRILNYSNPNVLVDWFRTGVVNVANNAQLMADWWSYPTTYRVSFGRIFYDGFDP